MTASQLVRLCGEGDRKALGLLYDTYAPRMLRLILRYIPDRTEAEDILHDGFVVVFSRISDLKEPEKLPYWMATVMRNLALRYLHDQDVKELLDDDAVQEEVPPIEAILSMEELNMIINRLPDGYRNVFRLAVLEGKSHREIAEILGIEPGTSSSQLFHARLMLRRLIADYKSSVMTVLLLLIAGGISVFLLRGRAETEIMPSATGGELYIASRVEPEEETKPEPVNTLPSTRMNAMTQVLIHKEERCKNDLSQPDTNIKHPVRIVTDAADSVSAVPAEPMRNVVDKREEHPVLISVSTRRAVSLLSVSLAVNSRFSVSMPSGDDYNMSNGDFTNPGLPPSEPGTPVAPSAPVETEEVSHDIPVEISLMLARRLNERLSFESGIKYLQYRTEAKGAHKDEVQTESYIGIPLHLKYDIISVPRLTVYGLGGATLNFPLKIDVKGYNKADEQSWHTPLQFSVEAGVGLQFELTRGLGLYVEPSLSYFLNAPSSHSYYRHYRPVDFSIPVGVRLSW